MAMDAKLAGRVGLLTGAATGMGRAGAQLFAQEGAAMVLLDVNATDGQAVADEIARGGGRATFIQGDVTRAADVQRAVNLAGETYGKLDLVWANAGIPLVKTAVQTSEEEWDRIVDVNLKGMFLVAKYAIPAVIAAGGGTMVLTASTFSFVAAKGWAAYCATKGGVLQLTRALALEHAEDNVRINCVCPGSTDTPLLQAEMRTLNKPIEEAMREDAAAHPMNRHGRPEEIARAALFLSCDDSSFSTGSALMVDGGYTAT
jgi:NAD(P)-dependent dehydrogenase (short-subunit alcohol dehydrogenase family)